MAFEGNLSSVFRAMPRKCGGKEGGEGGSDTQKRGPSPSPPDEEWFLEKPIPYISNDNFSQEDIFDYWNGKLSGHAHVKRTYPDVVRMWRQFHGYP